MLRKAKKEYFSKINTKLHLRIRNSGKLSNRITPTKIKISEIFEDTKLPDIFNVQFSNNTKTLDLKLSIIPRLSLSKIIEAFKDYVSIYKIFSLREDGCQFSFYSVSENDVQEVFLNMNEQNANVT